MFDNLRVLFLFFNVLVSLCLSLAQSAPSPTVLLYLDPSKPVDVRVDNLVSRMTLEEKASQLVNQARAIPRL
jgi:beta-glucosidase